VRLCVHCGAQAFHHTPLADACLHNSPQFRRLRFVFQTSQGSCAQRRERYFDGSCLMVWSRWIVCALLNNPKSAEPHGAIVWPHCPPPGAASSQASLRDTSASRRVCCRSDPGHHAIPGGHHGRRWARISSTGLKQWRSRWNNGRHAGYWVRSIGRGRAPFPAPTASHPQLELEAEAENCGAVRKRRLHISSTLLYPFVDGPELPLQSRRRFFKVAVCSLTLPLAAV